MRGRRTLAVLMAFGLVAAACSSGDSEPEQAAEPTPASAGDDGTSEPSDDGEPAPEEPTAAPEEPETPSSSSTGVPAPPDPTDFLPYAPVADAAEPPTAAPTAAQHVSAMFLRVAQEVLSDRRAADAGVLSEFDSSAAQDTPDLVLAAISAASSLSVESFSVIEAFSTVGAGAGYGPEFTEFFTVRADAANVLGEWNGLIHQAAIDARGLPSRGKTCVVEAITEDRESCEDDATADRMIADLVAATGALDFPDEPDEAESQVPLDVDFCALWVPVMVELDALGPIFELLVDDSLLDARFLGRDECRFEAGGDEDLVWGPQQATDAYTTLYAELVAAAIPAPFDEAAYDNDEYEVLLAKERATILAHAAAAEPSAGALIGGVAEPRARLGLITIAYLSAVEAWWQQLLIDNDIDAAEDPFTAVTELLFTCAPPAPDADLSDCTPTEAAIIETAFGFIDFNDYQVGVQAEVVEWEDVQAAFPLCDIWAAILVAIPPDQAQRIDFQVSQLDTEEILGMDGCETGIAQPGTDTAEDTSDG